MKKWVIVGMLSICGFFGIQAAAEGSETPASVEAQGGDMSIEVSGGGINFGNITPSLDKKEYFPEINQREHMKNVNTAQEAFLNEWLFNPYDKGIQVMPPIDYYPGTYMDARAYNVRVVDNTLGGSGWNLHVKRTPFVHVETGKQLENEHLFVGEIKDNAEVNGTSDDPNAPDHYYLSQATMIGFDNVEVAKYKGASAKGEHLISMLAPENEQGKTLSQPQLPLEEDYIYTEKNIMLALDKHSVIPEAGQYQSTILWTVQVTPDN